MAGADVRVGNCKYLLNQQTLAIFGCAETFFSPGISIWEHVGGFVAGLLLAFVFRKKMKIELEIEMKEQEEL